MMTNIIKIQQSGLTGRSACSQEVYMLDREKILKEIASICKGCRVGEGMSRQELSDKLDGVISKQTIYQFESGQNGQIFILLCYMMTFPKLVELWPAIIPYLGGWKHGETDES